MNECVLSTSEMRVIVEMPSTRIKSSPSANVSHKSRKKKPGTELGLRGE